MREPLHIIEINISRYKTLLKDIGIVGEKRRIIGQLLAEAETARLRSVARQTSATRDRQYLDMVPEARRSLNPQEVSAALI